LGLCFFSFAGVLDLLLLFLGVALQFGFLDAAKLGAGQRRAGGELDLVLIFDTYDEGRDADELLANAAGDEGSEYRMWRWKIMVRAS